MQYASSIKYGGLLYYDQETLESIASFVRDDVLEIIALTPWTESFDKAG